MLLHFTPALASLTGLFFAVILRFLDVMEREPFKPCLAAVLFGLMSYAAAFKFSSALGALFKVESNNILAQSIIIFATLTLVLILFQLCSSAIFYCIFRKHFQTLPDFVIYFLLIGVGFNTSEALVSAIYTINSSLDLPSAMYFSPYGYGQSTPLLFSLYGAALFIFAYKDRHVEIQPGLIASSFLVLAVLCQLVFSASIYLLNLSSSHVVGTASDISSALMVLVNNVSMLVSAALISSAVLYDLFIVQTFASGLDDIDSRVAGGLKNPIFYILSCHVFLWNLFDIQSRTSLSRAVFPRFSRLALLSWKKPQLYPDLLAEAKALIITDSISLP